MNRKGNGKDRKAQTYKRDRMKERGEAHYMDQVAELTQEIQDTAKERDGYKKAWEAEKILSKQYKTLADNRQEVIKQYRKVGITLIAVCFLAAVVIIVKGY